MTSAEFKALRPEFSASSYDAQIAALILAIPELDATSIAILGNELNLALSAFVAWRLAQSAKALKFGVGAMSAGSSTSTEKKVGDVSITTALSQTQASGQVARTANEYQQEWLDYIREAGIGAVAV